MALIAFIQNVKDEVNKLNHFNSFIFTLIFILLFRLLQFWIWFIFVIRTFIFLPFLILITLFLCFFVVFVIYPIFFFVNVKSWYQGGSFVKTNFMQVILIGIEINHFCNVIENWRIGHIFWECSKRSLCDMFFSPCWLINTWASHFFKNKTLQRNLFAYGIYQFKFVFLLIICDFFMLK